MNTVKLMNLMMMQDFVVIDLKNKNYYMSNKNLYTLNTLNKKFGPHNNNFHNRNKRLTNSNNNKFIPNYNTNFQKRNNYR